MAAHPRVVGAITGFAGTVVLVANDAAPFVEHASRLPIGIVGLLLIGAAAGLLANDRRTWRALVAGVLAAAVLYLVGRLAFHFLTGPSLTPLETWRLWLFVSLVATVALVSIGLAVGRLVRGWRPGGSLRQAAGPAVVVGAASVLVAGAIAVGFATTKLVIGPDDRVLTIRVGDGSLELSPSSVGEGTYIVVFESTASRPRTLSMVSANFVGLADEAPTTGSTGLTPADVEDWFAGSWLDESPDTPPRYHVDGGWIVEPGPATRSMGELAFSLAMPGRSLIWYASEPGRTIGPSSMGEGVAWPAEERAILTITLVGSGG